MLDVAIIAVAVLIYSLVSEKMQAGLLTPPMAFAAFGFAVGSGGFGIVHLDVSHGAIHLLAEITLVLVLFSDAARINFRLLIRDHNLPVRMLLIGMPLVIALGTAVAYVLPLGLSLTDAALLASVLAPTDAALGQSVVSNPRIPIRIRQALNVESGLNDGLAVPFVFFFAGLVGATHGSTDVGALAGFAAGQVILGPLAGLAVGFCAAFAIDRAARHGWMAESFEGPAVLAMAGLSYGLAQLIGGNGFIAAFMAGLLFGFVIENRCKFLLEFAESEGQTLSLLAFLVFGAAMLPEIVEHLNGWMLLYAILSLTLIRMVPITASLIGTGVSGTTMAFLGWFGPRGLASILFALLVLEEMHTPATSAILTITVLTVGLSILLHGVSAAPLSKLYARFVEKRGECVESEPVSDMPTRTGYVGPTAA